jgi:20S proteasome subunit alpha 6
MNFTPTYLEKHQNEFASASRDALIIHTLQALQGCCSGDDELTTKNGCIAIVGKDEKFTIIEDDALLPYLAQIETGGNNVEEEVAEDAPMEEA